ncbi:hypothetical protein [Photobacterium phosphoreum]|uniref:hypothetical protein n=1 Tax=Photobacterium phosphoreum TaxID=659 RepID=UPI0005D3635A|nr:hypothetical protein [Photobacterium phosphoreum]KJF86886.1 hypothetical protein UB41_09290 [Photobacterium phosphoreum]MCD9478942.1 hypothetical protein [Photobacterium phosphoreum]PQJ91191.1 hypothetical protein BTO21_05530 [Photobacterium phosphoreum]PSU40230.1 hypothetical protein CTM85_02335 [Photobacterium phosphoreum]PSV71257.1 hypothetical protein CTM77_09075 [Photobacterium phosphoreum]
MFDISKFNDKEVKQSHSFVLFEQGPPYCMLGWEKYRLFNADINDCLNNIKREFDVKVYVYEHEVINIENFFLWGFSFFQENAIKRDELSEILILRLTNIFKRYFLFGGDILINNHREGFNNIFAPDLMMVYVGLVESFELDVNLKYAPPKIKTYQKEDFELSVFEQPVTVSEFKGIIKDYIEMKSSEDLIYRFSSNGYFSNKYRCNKYLREEFIPLFQFVKARGVSEDAYIKLGIQSENYDAKITDNENELIIEVTSGAPKNDFSYFIATRNNGISVLPLKVLAHLKREIDSLAERIILSINKKHDKNYDDERTLLVTVPLEYTYQNEAIVIDEVLKEVKSSVQVRKFKEIVLMFDSKLYSL